MTGGILLKLSVEVVIRDLNLLRFRDQGANLNTHQSFTEHLGYSTSKGMWSPIQKLVAENEQVTADFCGELWGAKPRNNVTFRSIYGTTSRHNCAR